MTCALLALGAVAVAAEPLDGRLAAAHVAIARAEDMPMRGNSADMLAQARQQLMFAEEAAASGKSKNAIQRADEAEAAARLAMARYRYNLVNFDIEAKTSRNGQLRRRLFVLPAGNGQ